MSTFRNNVSRSSQVRITWMEDCSDGSDATNLEHYYEGRPVIFSENPRNYMYFTSLRGIYSRFLH